MSTAETSNDNRVEAAPAGVVFSFSVVALVALSLVLGGSTGKGFVSDALLQLVAIPILAVCLWRFGDVRVSGSRRILLAFPALILLLAVLQLIPLPPSIWTLLPGRGGVLETFQAAGVPTPWLPLSLDASATWRSALSLLPALGVFYAVFRLPTKARRLLALIILGAGIGSVFLGLLQLAQGPDSALRFYSVTAPNRTVGFFANPNHHAALLYCSIPLAVAWCARLADERSADGRVAFVGMLLAAMFLVMGVALARSLGGLGLGFLSFIASSVIVLPHIRRLFGGRGLALFLAAGILAMGLAAMIVLPRAAAVLGGEMPEQTRLVIAEGTLEAIWNYFPFGSGLGTFIPVYAMGETLDVYQNNLINRAHNDWLEWTLEGGVLAVGLLLFFLALYASQTFRVWKNFRSENNIDWDLKRCCSVIVALLLLHSLVDYPLRTTAMMVVFAFACAIMIAREDPAETKRERRGERERDFERPLELRLG